VEVVGRELDSLCGSSRGGSCNAERVTTSAGERLREDAVLWTVGEVSTGELVLCACDALVDGLDSDALRALAGANEGTSAFDIDDLLRSMAQDFGFEYSHGTDWQLPVCSPPDAREES
jgi:hypothetical protein